MSGLYAEGYKEDEADQAGKVLKGRCRMIEKLIEKLAEMIWKYIEPRIVAACEEGFKRGCAYGYIDGHEVGYTSGQDDLIRRVSYLYDFVRHAAEQESAIKKMEIPVEEISDKEFQAIIKEMEKAEFEAVVDDMGEI